MSYKVDYYTLSLMPDGEHGNIKQGAGTIYTDSPIETIPTILNDHLRKKKRVGIIENIKDVIGECIG